MIQQIPLNGGLVTQVDAEEVSINACTELVNAEFDKPGLIYKRKGSGAEISTGKSLVSITRWYNPNIAGNYYWIGIDSSDNVWYSTNLTSWTEISFTPAITDDTEVVKLVNYNTQLRFPCGLTDDARIYQYIDRDFFWSGEEGTPAFYSDIARPRDIIADHLTANNYVITNHNWLKESSVLMGTGVNLSTTDYYYRYSLVFDGNQESPISAPIDDTLGGSGTVIPTLQLEFDAGASLANWNKRITGLNLYRSTAFAGPFNKVLATSTKSNDGNIIKVTDCLYSTGSVNGGVYLEGTSSSLSGKIALINGFKKTLGTHVSGTIHNLNETWGSTAYDGGTATTDDRCWNDSFTVIDSNLHTANGEGTFESDTDLSDSGWTATNFTIDGSTCQVFNPSEPDEKALIGSNVLYLGFASSGTLDALLYAPVYTVSPSTTYYIEAWIAPDPDQSVEAGDIGLQVGVGTSSTASGNLVSPTSVYNTITNSNKTSSTYTMGNGKSGWEKLSAKITTGGSHDKLSVAFRITNTTTAFHIDQLTVGKFAVDGDDASGGRDVILSPSLNLGSNNSHRGQLYQRGAGGELTDERGFILKNSQKAIQVSTENDFPYNDTASGTNLIISPDYLWMKDSNNQRLFYVDQGVDGVEHPTGETSLDVKHRHSKYINGRNYVADVRITDGDDTEDHDNWVMFSELNQPDVIPISNYIQLTDAQGGKIVGIESLMGDLAVLMENGIFRLSIPSTEPTAWSLSESEENIGCLSENSITAWESGLFFAGMDHLYYLDVNFKATPVTASIKDDYQSAVTSSARTFYDAKKNRLLCRFGADGPTIYSLDLSQFPEERWTKVTTGSGDMDIFTVDENLSLYAFDTATNKIKPHDDTKSESTSFKRTTGWISNTDLDRSGVLRRLNLKYKSGDDITAKIYIDGDDSTAVKTITIPSDTTGADWYKCKPSVRCRSYKIELSTSASTSDVEIRRIEVEFE